jgi:gelsolin
MASQASFEDSNIAMLSSALHHEVKLDAAKQEKAFQGAGSKAGLEVWRIERFELAKWPADQVGTFFSGDAFIVLHSYLLPEQKTEKLNYDLYFWLGKDSTQDEQG